VAWQAGMALLATSVHGLIIPAVCYTEAYLTPNLMQHVWSRTRRAYLGLASNRPSVSRHKIKLGTTRKIAGRSVIIIQLPMV
jgi:hypothetical protein